MADLTPEQLQAKFQGQTVAASPVVGEFSWSDQDRAWWGLDALAAQQRLNYFADVPAGTPGAEAYTPTVDGAPGAPVYRVNDKVPAGVVIQQLGTMNKRDLMRLQDSLKRAGYLKNYIPGLGTDDATVKAFGDLLVETARAGVGDPNVTWQGYLFNRISEAKANPELSGIGGSAGGPSRSTYKAVTTIDATSAKSALRDLIGRDPSQDELDKFSASYNGYAKAHPTVQTTVTDGEGNTTSTNTGGFDEKEVARQSAAENPDYANYQAVATYFPMMQRLLGDASPLNVVEDVS